MLKLHVVQIVLHLKSVRGAENLENRNHVTSVDDCYRKIRCQPQLYHKLLQMLEAEISAEISAD